MAVTKRYRQWFEHERFGSEAMLTMIESVPAENRGDPRFAQAVTLAGHLAACRENWLDLMTTGGTSLVEWWPESSNLETLRPRFAAMESHWAGYLGSLSDQEVDRDFEFSEAGGRYRWNIEGQIVQLMGHAHYHRGQIALLVDSLGGKVVDTDYVFWMMDRNPRYGPIDS